MHQGTILTNQIVLFQPDEGYLLESPYKPDLSKLNDVGEALRKKLNLDLFGVDVIIECDTQRYAVIDINVFPSRRACFFILKNIILT